jgi:hypothetical protein
MEFNMEMTWQMTSADQVTQRLASDVIRNRFNACGKKRVLPQGVAHQAARRVFLVGVKNHLMLRELVANV